MTHDLSAFTPLLSHPRLTEKLLLLERIRADAIARKQSADDACNNRLRVRSDRRVTIQRLLDQSRNNPRRAENHHELEAELVRLSEGDRDFSREIYAERQRVEEEYGRTMSPADATLNWLDEQWADWRAAGEPEGPWLRHVAAPPKGKEDVGRVGPRAARRHRGDRTSGPRHPPAPGDSGRAQSKP